MRLEGFKTVKVQILIFRVYALCIDQHFGGSRFLLNIG